MDALLLNQMLVLFAILALGSWIGGLSLRGFSLGAVGVLFTGMLFGHFGLSVPQVVMELGLLLFVYAVGLQAGPQFFRAFRRRGLQWVTIGVATAVSGALVALGMAALLRLPIDLAAGLYTGAMTCTPALAAAIDALGRGPLGSSGNVSVGYGVAYPFGMLGVVLVVQLLPRILGRRVSDAEAAWRAEQQAETPCLEARQYRVTNPNVYGISVRQVNPHRLALANISRVKRGERVFAATPDVVLAEGDIVMVVGACDELEKMRLLLGEETHTRMDMNTDVISMDVEVTEGSLAGQTLAAMRVFERYNVVVTRVRRQGVELAPTGAITLEMGDTIRIVGERAAAEEFARLVHGSAQRADETHMTPFLAGLLLGIAVGTLAIPLSDSLEVRLGAAGGAFLVSLLVGHFGRIGPLRLWVPAAARKLSRELGLMLFLAGAGTNAGAHFVEVIRQQGPALLLAGALITLLPVLVGVLLMHGVYRLNLLSSMGALCACMTNPPALSAASNQTETELPTLSYASVYPVALIFKILLAQVLVEVLLRVI